MSVEIIGLPRTATSVRSQGLIPERAHGSIKPLLAILVGGAALRLILWIAFDGAAIHDDERDYNTLAVNLLEHCEYSYTPGSPVSLRPPLYPVFIAGIYLVFGLENFQAVRLAQAVLSLFTVVVLFRVAVEAFSRRTALWACGLYCFYPSLLGFNNLLYAEVLFTFLLCTTCYTLVLFFRHESLWYLAASAVMIGLASLTRSVLWLFPPVLCLYLFCIWKVSLTRRAAGAVLLMTAFAATLAPWSIRNSLLQRTFVTVDVMGGRNLMMGNYQHTPMFRAWAAIAMQGEMSWDHEVASVYPHSERDTQGKVDKLALRQAMSFILANPLLTLKRDIVKFFQFWGLERELIAGTAQGYFGPVSKFSILLLTLLVFGSYVLAFLSGLFGMILTPPTDRRIHGLFLLLILYICGLHTLTFGHSRYHLPVMPIILLYAAAMVTHAATLSQQRSRLSFALAYGLCAVFSSGWLCEVLVIDLDRFLNMLNAVSICG